MGAMDSVLLLLPPLEGLYAIEFGHLYFHTQDLRDLSICVVDLLGGGLRRSVDRCGAGDRWRPLVPSMS